MTVAIFVADCTLATVTDMEDGGGSISSSSAGGVRNGGGCSDGPNVVTVNNITNVLATAL